MQSYDVIVVGAGIVGLATALRLKEAQPALKLAIIEKEKGPGLHQTGHNSGVIHSGIYYKPGSLKALNCKKGYDELIRFCEQHDLPYELCGKVIVATNAFEASALPGILERGLANGLEGIRIISQEETLEHEPYVRAHESIWVPQTGIIDYLQVAQKYLEVLKEAGADAFFGYTVDEIVTRDKEVIVRFGIEEASTRLVINCGGLYADKVGALTEENGALQVVPFRGEYYELKEEKEYLVNNLIYPVPNPNFPFLGVHFTRMIKGGIEAGPNAVLAFAREGYSRWDVRWDELIETFAFSGFRKLALKYWKEGLGELYRSYSKKAFVKALQNLLPSIQEEDLVRGGAGVRAMAVHRSGDMLDDFHISSSPGVVNVYNAPSPAATSSLAIGATIAQQALEQLQG